MIWKNLHIVEAEKKERTLSVSNAVCRSPLGDAKHLRPIIALALILAGVFAVMSVPPAGAQSTVNVTIDNYAFTPATITVVIGVNNTVTWTNEQSSPPPAHTVIADDNSWGSGTLSKGVSYTHTFTAAGTFGYHCSIHTYMQGTVIVLGASSSSSITTTSTTQSSTSSSGGGVPEFPFQAVAAGVITLAVVASYLLLRDYRKGTVPASGLGP